MTTDGSLIFDTKMNTDGIAKGTKKISSKVVELKNKISASENEIANLRQELEAMANTPIKSNATEKLEKDIAKAKTQLRSLYEEADRIGNAKQSDLKSMGFGTEYLDDMLAQDKSWQKVQSQIEETETKLHSYEQELQNVKNAESQITGKDTVEYKKKQQKLDELSGQLNVYKAKLREAEAQESRSSRSVCSASDTMNAFSKKIKEVYNRLKKAFAKSVVNRIKKIGNNTAHANKQMGLLSKSIQRIKQALAGLLLYQILQGVIDSIKEGINSLVKVSPQVNKNLSALMTSLEYLRNTLATAFAPILNVVTPILTGFIDTLSATIEKIAQFIAALTGESTYTKAIKLQKDYAESLDESTNLTKKNTEATDENQNQLAGYDELNVMDHDNSSNISADTSTEETAFTTVHLKVNSFSEKLKQAIKKQDFNGVGQLLADKLNQAMEKIKWAKIRNTAKKWASNIADLINGFIKKFDWSLVGKTLSEGINTAMISLHTFVITLDWKEFGENISKSFNSFVEKFSWKTLGDLLADKMNIPIDILTGFVYTFNWKNFGEGIKNSLKSFLKTFKLEDVGNILGCLLEGIAITAQDIFTSPSWTTLGEKISSALNYFFSHDPFGSVVDIIKSALSALFDSAIELFDPKNLNTSLLGEDVAQAINEFFSDDKWWEKVGETVSDTALGITDFLCEAIGDIEIGNIANAIEAFFTGIDWHFLAVKLGELIFKVIVMAISFVHSLVLKIPFLGDLMATITGVNEDNLDDVYNSFMDDFTIRKDEVTGELYKGSGTRVGNIVTGEDWEELKKNIEKYGDEALKIYEESGLDALNEWIDAKKDAFEGMNSTLSNSREIWKEYGDEVAFTVDGVDYTLEDLANMSEDEFLKMSEHFNTDDWTQWGDNTTTVADILNKANTKMIDSTSTMTTVTEKNIMPLEKIMMIILFL